MNIKKTLAWLVMIAGLIAPVFIIYLFPKLFHGSDMDDFWRWSQAWGASWRDIYINCDRCNYPFVGTLASAGIMHWMGISKFKYIVAPFRYYLAMVDALNVLAAYFIMTRLKIKYAPLWAGLIGLLPSSWMGTSAWGQIDGVGQMLIMAIIILIVWFNTSSKENKARYYFFVIAAGLLMSMAALTKQLILFSLISLGFMVLVNIWLYSRKPATVISSLLIFAFAFVIPILLIDLNLNLKSPYLSHLQYVLATGSQHGDTISSFGFNIWTFLAKDPRGSSHIPLGFHLGSTTLFSVIPYSTGIFLFLLLNVFLLFVYTKYFYRQYAYGIRFFSAENILLLLLHLALVNLSFNLFLTGTHERYLYHFYPFIIIACLGLSFFKRGFVYLLMAGATFYGAVLYGYLTRLNIQFGQVPFEILGLFHSLVFVYLIFSLLRYFKSSRFDALSST
ncbi:MAG: hypothetical protein U0V02_09470 [Anaerolineales bacterium]